MSFLCNFLFKPADSSKEGRGISWKAVAVWLLCFLPALLILLNNHSVLHLRHEKMVLTGISHENGFGYISLIGPGWVDWDDVSNSDTIILEDGRPLALQDNLSVDVRNSGNGRYNIMEDRAMFSSSDNTDPRTNKRVYEIDGNLKFPRVVSWLFYFLSVIAAFMIAFLHRSWFRSILSDSSDSNMCPVSGGASKFVDIRMPSRKVVSLVVNQLFYASVLIFVVLFLMTRLWFFVDYPFPGVYTDSAGYHNIVVGWEPLRFIVRPPAYLLLLKIAYSLVDMVMMVVALQNALSLVAGLVMIYAVHRVKPVLSILTAIVFALWFAGCGPFEYDTSLMSESLYTTMLVLSFSLLLLGIYKERAIVLAFASAAMAGVILTRSAGMFLIVTYLMVLAFLLWMRYSRVKIAAFLIPFPALLFSLCFYNYLTARVFAVTAFGGSNLAGITLFYWEQDGSYPSRVNEGIAKVQAAMGKRGEYMETIRSSSNPYDIARVLSEGYHEPQYLLARSINFGDATAGTIDKWLRRISFDAIKKHPDLYTKGVKAMLSLYFRQVERDEDFISVIKDRVSFFNIDARPSWSTFILTKEYANPVDMKGVSISGSGPNVQIAVEPTALLKAYRAVHEVRKYLFARAAWSVVPFAVFLVSAVMLIRSRARSKGAFFIFIMTSAVIGAALVVSFVEVSLPRYSYPTEFIYYLSLVLLPLVFMKDGRGAEKEE